MEESTAEELLAQLRELDEHPRVEAKRGTEIGPSVMQTVCALANEPGLGGGWLMIGVSEADEQHETFWVSGVPDPDRLLNDLLVNCREQFEQPIPVSGTTVLLEGQRVLCIFVPELDAASKPCTFKGRFDSKNKRKTGVWRRGLNGDYECQQEELEPLLLARAGTGFEQVILPHAHWSDLDPRALELYRALRARVRPHAQELEVSDEEMLHALNLVSATPQGWRPNVAGLLLFGRPLSLRRLLPAVRVDYVRVAGTQWVEDPDTRFVTTWEHRAPLLQLIPQLVAMILDDMPRAFQLAPDALQRSDEPLLPYQVVREAVVNALMHRDYRVHQPTLIVRFSNRLEMHNAGYSLKPASLLGEMGSRLRNPLLASVLYDLNLAETKGSGIRTMRLLLERAGLTAPLFQSEPWSNEFRATYLFHHLLDTHQLRWLEQFSGFELGPHESKALLLARELGAVENAALRAVTGLDTLAASQVLRKLAAHQLLARHGAGSATYYQLSAEYAAPDSSPSLHEDASDRTDSSNTGGLEPNAGDSTSNAGGLAPNTGDSTSNTGDFEPNTGDFEPNTGGLEPNTGGLEPDTGTLTSNTGGLPRGEEEMPPALKVALARLTPKARRHTLWPIILELCAWRPHTPHQLAQLFGRQVRPLKEQHLYTLRHRLGYLDYTHPDVVHHPDQAYMTTQAGLEWLASQETPPDDA